MKVTFRIHYLTRWGQKLCICGSLPELGSWDPQASVPMTHEGEGFWSWEGDLDTSRGFEYKYLILNDSDDQPYWEWGENRIAEEVPEKYHTIRYQDAWRAHQLPENTFSTSAFTRALMSRQKPKEQSDHSSISQPQTGVNYRFQLYAPRIEKYQQVYLSGSHFALGEWATENAVLLEDSDYPVWKANVQIKGSGELIEYKYLLFDTRSGQFTEWEEGENRSFLHQPVARKKTAVVQSDHYFRHPNPWWKGSGVALPVFSLRSENSTGVGEFADIKLLTDWAVNSGMKLVQILPINDTVATHTWTDSYPYAAISVFALHPIYLNPEAMGILSSKRKMSSFLKEKKRLNSLAEVDYEAVMKLKSKYFKDLYDQEKEAFLKKRTFKTFFKQNKHWLLPYGVFSMLRDKYGTPDFSKWGGFAEYDQKKTEALASPDQKHYDDIAIHYFIQFHLHQQMKDSADYARKKGVVLKGDIPIGIYRHSVDAWIAPHLYNMNGQAGAPPDDFAITGQNWGFPTYNWEEMQRDGFEWWKNRLRQLAKYFDSFRIDHILGFFRIWEIPEHAVEGLMGRFNPSLPLYREELARRGLWMDYERYCRPYAPEHVVQEYFGEYADRAKREFLEMQPNGRYQLKEAFKTQKQIERWAEGQLANSQQDSQYIQRAKDALFGLTREILFIEAPDTNGEAFNPRIALQFTRSFEELDYGTQQTINAIYTDYYYHRHESFWRDQAMVKLPALKEATDMLICGEDLGMVPACVPGVMHDLGILSLEIQRMPKNPAREFGIPHEYPYTSVSSPSSHDMSTVRGWWEENRDKVQRFYNQVLGYSGEAPEVCEPWVCRDIVEQHLYSPSMWTIFPIQDLLGMDGDIRRKDPHEERINIPANPKHYWRYRLHLNLEDLIGKQEFTSYVKEMIRRSGR